MNLPELCILFKKKREELHLSLEEVSLKTRLTPTVIADIEQGNIQAISPVYLKGFLKIYASFLKDEELLTLIQQVEVRREEKARMPQEEFRKDTAQFSSVAAGKQFFRVIFSVLTDRRVLKVLGVIAGVVIVFLAFSSFARKLKTAKKTQKLPVAAVKFQPSKQSVSPVSTSKRGDVFLAVRTKKDSFITVKVDGKTVFQSVLRKGEEESWKGKKTIEIHVKNPSDVSIQANGEPIPTPRQKKSAVYLITASGFSLRQ